MTQTEETAPNIPAAVRTGGVAAAVEKERIDLANDGTRTADLIGTLLILQPIRSEMWTTENGERDVTVTRVLSVRDEDWIDHGDLPIFWGVVRKSLEEQSSDAFPWVVGRIVQRPAKANAKRNPPYVLLAPTPEEVARANVVLGEWADLPAPVFETAPELDENGEPF